MKLIELRESNNPTIYAWLEPGTGPSGVRGVRLVYLQPTQAEYDRLIGFAQVEAERGDAKMVERVKQLTKEKHESKKKGTRFNTPDLGWWKTKDDFVKGREGAHGVHKGTIMHKYPNMQFVDSKQEAIKKAEAAGLI